MTQPTDRLSRLSDAERDAFESIEVEGLRPVELAEVTDTSASKWRTLVSRARDQLGGEEVAEQIAEARREEILMASINEAENEFYDEQQRQTA